MIEEIPLPIPPGLRDAAQRGTLIPFVGAGASRIAGCPGWAEFSDGALRQLVEHGKISHGQLDQLRDQPPRVKLSIARSLAEEHGFPIDFRKLLHSPGHKDNLKGRRLYGSLSKLGKVFVTTNYDEWLDEEIVARPLTLDSDPERTINTHPQKRQVLHKKHDFTYENLNQPNTVIHLHGSLENPGGMILTTQDYVQHYANDRLVTANDEENLVLTFLNNLFNREKTVLFVGYGLEELEILEYVILKAQRNPGSNHCEARHYLLQGFFSHEYELMRSLKGYYLRECGIQLLPFQRDQNDRDQLLNVLDKYAELMPASNLMYLQEFKEMGDLLNG